VLVTGATGNTGRPLVELLRECGVRVRAMVRSRSARDQLNARGIDAVVADFDDPHAVSAALAGVGSAYLVTSSSQNAQAQQEQFVELAARRGCSIWSSSRSWPPTNPHPCVSSLVPHFVIRATPRKPTIG